MVRKGYRDYQEELIESLKDVNEAVAYLNVALQDEDPRIFLIALRNVIQAQGGGMTAIAEKTDLNRESLYRMLSHRGNPALKNVSALLNSMGLGISIDVLHHAKKSRGSYRGK